MVVAAAVAHMTHPRIPDLAVPEGPMADAAGRAALLRERREKLEPIQLVLASNLKVQEMAALAIRPKQEGPPLAVAAADTVETVEVAECMAVAAEEAMEPRAETAVIVTGPLEAAAATVGSERMAPVTTAAVVVATAQTITALAEMAGPMAKQDVLY